MRMLSKLSTAPEGLRRGRNQPAAQPWMMIAVQTPW
jgi:hypothetical protein